MGSVTLAGEGMDNVAHNPHLSLDRLLRELRFFHRSQTVVDVLIGVRRDDQEILQTSLAGLKEQARQR